MKRKWLVLGLLMSVPLMAWAANTIIKSGVHRIAHTIVQTGDTAVVVKFNQFTARDGYTYLDSIRCSSTKVAASWTSPMTVRRVTVAATPDTTKVDTLHADLGTNKTGVVWTVPNIALTRAAYIDSMVARFNAVATLSDTIVAQDSTTYIKLVSLIAQDNLEGDARWTIDITNAGNMAEGDSTFTTVKMVCDSMVYTINNLATVKDSVTAAVSGDTVYTITADRAGWAMVFKVGPADTTQDTVHVTNAATSFTHHTDTIPLFSMYQNGWQGLWGKVVVNASTYTTKGYGGLDSCYYHINAVTGDGSRFAIVDDSTTIPATFYITQLANDTLWKEYLELVISLADSATDTSGTAYHDVNWYFIPVE